MGWLSKVVAFALISLTLAVIPNAAHAFIVCGTATIDGGGVVTKEDYCYDNGIPNGGGGGGGGPGGTGGGGSGGAGAPTATQQAHDMNCANAYGSYKAKAGVPTVFSDGWAFVIDDLNMKLETSSKAQPPPYVVNGRSYNWQMIDGDTINFGTPNVETIIYRHAGVNMGNMVNTLVHEFAHQNGKDDDVAYPAGDAAEDAYNADGGAKCN